MHPKCLIKHIKYQDQRRFLFVVKHHGNASLLWSIRVWPSGESGFRQYLSVLKCTFLYKVNISQTITSDSPQWWILPEQLKLFYCVLWALVAL